MSTKRLALAIVLLASTLLVGCGDTMPNDMVMGCGGRGAAALQSQLSSQAAGASGSVSASPSIMANQP